MKYQDDPDLERRLRNISASPEPPVPGSVFSYAGEVTTRKKDPRMPILRFASRRRLLGLGGVAIALVMAVSVGDLLLSVRHSNPAAGPTTFSGSQPLPADFELGGLGPTDAWTAITFRDAPAAAKNWNSAPRAWAGGWFATANADEPSDPGILWLSKDGHLWHAVWGPHRVFPGLEGLVAFQDGYTWRSKDGISWRTRRSQPSDPYTPDDPWEAVDGGTPGLLMPTAVGIKFSSDGVNWSKVALPGVIGDPIGGRFAWTGSHFVICGADASFTSADGRTWQRHPYPEAGWQTTELYATGSGMLAVLFSTDPAKDPGHQDPRYLWSAEGASWESADLPAHSSIPGIVSNGSRLLIDVNTGPIGNGKPDPSYETSLDGKTWVPLSLTPSGIGVSNYSPVLAPDGICLDGGLMTSYGSICTFYAEAR